MKLALLALLVGSACGLFSEDDNVVELGDFNFKDLVLDTDDLWLVEFYAPWCGHCKSLVPEWKKLADALNGIANVGAVDMTEHKSVGEPYGVTGFPTIKAFSANRNKPVDYDGDRTAKALASFALKEVKEVVKKRLGIKSSGGGAKKAKKAKAPSDVVTGTAANFEEEVMQTDDVVIVEFYAPWCGHCKNLVPEWEKAATLVKGKGAKLVAVDATVHSALATEYGVSGYPTIKVFKGEKGAKGEPSDYNGGRTAQAIAQFALEAAGVEAEAPAEQEEEDSAVVVLTNADFEEKVVASDDLWIVEFFAPWCGHCKTLAPEWRKAADALAEETGSIKLATVDATVERDLAETYGIGSFPTIKVFGADKAEPTEYEGGRVKDSIVKAALALLEEMTTEPRPVLELASQEVFDEQCGANLCLVAFLPHILDTGAAGREAYLDILRSQAIKYKNQNMGFVWAEATLQGKLESMVDVGGGGYPAMAAVNIKKGLNIPFFGGFSAEGVTSFVKRVMKGKEAPQKLASKAVVIDATTPWDGKDGEMPKEEL